MVKSDFRYVPRDKTAYLAYKRMKQQASGMSLWEAQRAYVDWLARNDPLAFMILDPIVSVHPDELFFEVFSKDEGSYAKLGVDWSALGGGGDKRYGTTNIDFSDALHAGVQRMRSYRATRIAVAKEAVKLETAGAPAVMEKKVSVPDSWLRGFLQVQSAGALPRTVVHLAPIDLYNLLRHLRLHGDLKKRRPRRALRARARRAAAPGARAVGDGADHDGGRVRRPRARGDPRLGPPPADAPQADPALRRAGRGAPARQRACRASGCSAQGR